MATLAKVYPRECGAAFIDMIPLRQSEGLSPRVRGSPRQSQSCICRWGSIPASAGQPRCSPPTTQDWRVYPRECGAALSIIEDDIKMEGLSPRVRGSLQFRHSFLLYGRSIPASAGQPMLVGDVRRMPPVYPRECGAAHIRCKSTPTVSGLSPRVRGSRVLNGGIAPGTGSIPASAGQPGTARGRTSRPGVYPRECGAAGNMLTCLRTRRGLSPRVRGSHGITKLYVKSGRSIPASAGQPSVPAVSVSFHPVYPRECGAAPTATGRARGSGGLSPRVRGSRAPPCRRRRIRRSIPASAGQPCLSATESIWIEVYPRECGAAPPLQSPLSGDYGLSPRVRGSLGVDRRDELRCGSIPASAGQPLTFRRRGTGSRVYPRECGAAPNCACVRAIRYGLSPRVRGSPLRRLTC